MDKKAFIDKFISVNKENKKNIYHRMDGRVEWVCEHGVGHTIYSEDSDYVHGCDGCCSNVILPKGKHKIIIINGVKGVGKDTFVKIFKFHAFRDSFVYNFSSVDFIKEFAYDIGWNGNKTIKDRQFFHDFKQLLINYNDYPFSYVTNFIDSHIRRMPNKDLIFFIHIREAEEIKKIVDRYPEAITLLIENKNLDNEENYVYDYDNYTWVIENEGGMPELEDKIVVFIQEEFAGW